jgi:hypothetical protein
MRGGGPHRIDEKCLEIRRYDMWSFLTEHGLPACMKFAYILRTGECLVEHTDRNVRKLSLDEP